VLPFILFALAWWFIGFATWVYWFWVEGDDVTGNELPVLIFAGIMGLIATGVVFSILIEDKVIIKGRQR